MRKLLLIGLVLMVLLVSSVSALEDANLWVYYTFDDADNSGSNPQDQSGNTRHGTTNGATTGVSGKLGQAFSFDGTNDDIDISQQFQSGSVTWSMNTWVNRDDATTTDWIFGNDCADADLSGTNYYMQGFQRNDGNAYFDYGSDISSSWAMITVIWNDADNTMKVWVDGVYSGGDTSGNGNAIDCSAYGGMHVGSRAGGAHWFKGDIDDFAVWTGVALDQDDIDFLYNSGTGRRADAAAASAPSNFTNWNVTSGNVETGTPTTNWGTGGAINITGDLLSFTISTNQNSNMSCALNYDANYTTMVANNSLFKATTTSTTNHSMTLSESIPRGTSYLYCAWIGTDTGLETATAQAKSLVINRVDSPPSVSNMSLFAAGDNETDEDLYLSYQLNYATDSAITWYTDGSLNQTFANLTQIADGYTSKHQNWTAVVTAFNGTEKSNGSVTIIILNDVPTAPTIYSPTSFNKTYHRDITLQCTQAEDLDYDTLYYEFWVNLTTANKLRQNSTSSLYTYAFDNGNGTYEWKCRANDQESAGPYLSPLNIYFNTTILTGNQTAYNYNVNSGGNVTHKLNISYNPDRVTDVSAIFVSGSSQYVVTETELANISSFSVPVPIIMNSTDYDLINYWNVTATASNSSTYKSQYYANQKVEGTEISVGCSGSNDTVWAILNLTIKDEINDTLLNGDIQATLYVWSSDQSITNNITYNLDIDNVNNTLVCMDKNPSNTSFKTLAQFRYEDSGYDPRDYWLIEQTLNNVTANFNFYLLQIALANGIDMKVEDQSQTALPQRFIIVQRYNVADNSYKTVTITRTDDDGQAYAFLRKFDAEYLFKIQDGLDIEFISENRKITTDELTFVVRSASYSDIIADIGQARGAIWYDNTTNNIIGTFSGSGEVERTCMTVNKHTIQYGTEEINTTCTTDPTGTVAVDISAEGNGTFSAYLYVYENPQFILDTFDVIVGISNAFQQLNNDLGKEGIIIALFCFIAIITVALATGSTIYVVLMGVLILAVMAILGFLSLSLGMIVTLTIMGGLLIAFIKTR